MAKSGDKKRLEENKLHLQRLRISIAVASVLYIGVRLVWRRQTASAWHVAGLILASAIYAFCQNAIAGALAPHYSSTGDLLYSGASLKTGGVLSYYHDVLYVTIFSQIVGSFSNYGWFVMLSIPVYATYALVVNVLMPAWNAKDVAIPPESEADRKRQEKHARQAARAQKFASQRR